MLSKKNLFIKAAIAILAAITLLVIFSISFYFSDKDRVFRNEKPKFVIHEVSINDGGSKIYYGLGYQIIVWNQMTADPKIKLKGVETHYLFGIVNASEGPNIGLRPEKEVD